MLCGIKLVGSKKGVAAAVLVGMLVAFQPASVWAMGPRPTGPLVASQFVDVAIVRPLAMVGAWVSSGVFFATLPLTFFTGVGTQSARYLVVAPWRFTVARPVGDFDRYIDGRSLTDRAIRPPS